MGYFAKLTHEEKLCYINLQVYCLFADGHLEQRKGL